MTAFPFYFILQPKSAKWLAITNELTFLGSVVESRQISQPLPCYI